MLVLTRKAGESIVIGNEVVITGHEVRGGPIRRGVDAPRNLAGHRAEINQQGMEENQAASLDAAAAVPDILKTTASSLTLRNPDGDGQ